ncbi:HET-domain-containing protein, partial [Decorospora gaudefroyi]
YGCLSHRWGSRQPLQTRKETLSRFKAGIPWESIPKTFQDAITFTRKLGLSYIWIDSLCIIQDDKQDWQQQSGAMAAIYSNSYVTLAAAVADDSKAGFGGVDMPIFVRRPYQHGGFPLLRRAWVHQERLLSHRIIYFAYEELIWECDETFECEKRWRRVVSEYSTLDLTHPRDALPALSGIVQVYKEALDDEYLAGFWKKSLLFDLLWYRDCPKDTVLSRCRAPSWSWVSTESSLMAPSISSASLLSPSDSTTESWQNSSTQWPGHLVAILMEK